MIASGLIDALLIATPHWSITRTLGIKGAAEPGCT